VTEGGGVVGSNTFVRICCVCKCCNTHIMQVDRQQFTIATGIHIKTQRTGSLGFWCVEVTLSFRTIS